MNYLNILMPITVLCLFTPINAEAIYTKANPESEGTSILATTKIDSNLYVFYSHFIKKYNDKISDEGAIISYMDLFEIEKAIIQRVDAAVYFGKDLLYLIEGNSAIAYDIPQKEGHSFRKNHDQSGSLQKIFRLPDNWIYLDAAIRLNESKVLFIKDNYMMSYDTDLMKPGQPVRISKSMLTKAVGSAKVEAGYLDKALKTVLILKD